MPRADRLKPPEWPGGRSAPPNGEFNVDRQAQPQGRRLAKVTGRASTPTTSPCRACCTRSSCAASTRTRSILSIDASAALAMPGVHAVITGQRPAGVLRHHPLDAGRAGAVRDKARYVGDASPPWPRTPSCSPRRRCSAIHVEYELLPAVTASTRRSSIPSGSVNEKSVEGNISKHVDLAFGDVDGELAQVRRGDRGRATGTRARRTRRSSRTAASRTSTPTGFLTRVLEHAGRALPAPRPGARCSACRRSASASSSRSSAARSAARASRSRSSSAPPSSHDHRPAGQDPLHARGGVLRAPRPPPDADALPHRRSGATASSPASTRKIHIDGGAYSSFGLVTTYYSGQLLTAPYRMPAYRFDSTRVFTNKPCCGPKRGHGSVQPRFAFECQLDKLAEAIGMDPIELRRRNFIGEHTRTVNGLRITSNGFLECLDAVERASEWKRRFRAPAVRPRARRGRQHVHQRHELLHLPERDAAGRRAAQARSQRPRHRVLRRVGHRPGRRLGAGLRRVRGARARAARRARRRGRHRSHAGRPRRLLEPRDVHGRQRLPRRRAQAARAGRGRARRALGLSRRTRSRWRAARRAARAIRRARA